MVYFGGFFPKLGFSRGFLYVYLIYIAGRISAAAMAGDIIFFSLAGPVEILYIILQTEERSCDGQVGGGGALYFLGEE